MKKRFMLLGLALAALALLGHEVHAQVELKTSPPALLFELINASVEWIASENAGVELDIWTAPGVGGALFNASGKYYIQPKYRADGIHVGGFLGATTDASVGIGFLFGYKWLSKKNFLFEVGAGLGRGFGEIEFLPYGKLHIGFRLNGKGKA